jgi:hypothetical protein
VGLGPLTSPPTPRPAPRLRWRSAPSVDRRARP